MTTAIREPEGMAERLMPVAAHLVTLVHGDGGPVDVQEALARLDSAEKDGLLVVLAGLVDPDQPMGRALGWLDADMPARTARMRIRELAEDVEPDLGDEDVFVDEVAVAAYAKGDRVTVTPRERVEAIVAAVRSGVTYLELDAMHGLTRGSTATFISRTRKAYVSRGEAFPEIPRSAAAPSFTEDQVVDIRLRSAAGATDLEIGLVYDTPRKTITNVVSGASYRNFGGPIRPKRQVNRPSKASRVLWGGGQEGFLKTAV
jgi:hypothetical protein